MNTQQRRTALLQRPGMNTRQLPLPLRCFPDAPVPIIEMTRRTAKQGDNQEPGMSPHTTKPAAPGEGFSALARWLGAAPGSVQAADIQSGVSFETGLRRCLGRLDLYDRIARRFLQTRVDEARTLQAALDRGDLEAVRRLAHDTASTAGTLGAEGLSATAQALQAAVDDSADADSLAQLAHLFSFEHAVVLTRLTSYARGDVDLKAIAKRKS